MASTKCYVDMEVFEVVGKIWGSWLNLLLFLAFLFRFLWRFALLLPRWDADFVLVVLIILLLFWGWLWLNELVKFVDCKLKLVKNR